MVDLLLTLPGDVSADDIRVHVFESAYLYKFNPSLEIRKSIEKYELLEEELITAK